MLNCVVWTVLQFLANSLIGETGKGVGISFIGIPIECMYVFKKRKKRDEKIPSALAHSTTYDRCKTISSYLKQKSKGIGRKTLYIVH